MTLKAIFNCSTLLLLESLNSTLGRITESWKGKFNSDFLVLWEIFLETETFICTQFGYEITGVQQSKTNESDFLIN